MKNAFTLALALAVAFVAPTFAYEGILERGTPTMEPLTTVEVEEAVEEGPVEQVTSATWEEKVDAYATAHPEKVELIYATLHLVVRTYTLTDEEVALVDMILGVLHNHLDESSPYYMSEDMEDESADDEIDMLEEVLMDELADMSDEEMEDESMDEEMSEDEAMEEMMEEMDEEETEGSFKSKDKTFLR